MKMVKFGDFVQYLSLQYLVTPLSDSSNSRAGSSRTGSSRAGDDEAKCYAYRYPPDVLTWSARHEHFLEEIPRSDADIVCLGEVHHFSDFFEPRLRECGYFVRHVCCWGASASFHSLQSFVKAIFGGPGFGAYLNWKFSKYCHLDVYFG